METVASNQKVGTGPPSHWGERARRPCRQTSLVVDPPNGRTPDMLPEAKARRIPEGAGNNKPKADSWEDFSYYIRCISRGVTGSILPVIYGNGQQIVQAPGYVTILQEMVHEARVIPLDGRPHAGPNIRSYMGDPRGHWEGNTLVVETTNFLGNRTGIGLQRRRHSHQRCAESDRALHAHGRERDALRSDRGRSEDVYETVQSRVPAYRGTRLQEFRIRVP